MKAYRLHAFGGPDSLKCEEIPSPAPGPGQVRVRVRATSLNFRDLMVTKGVYNPKLKLPLIPLSDGAGEVSAVGEGVTRFRVGDRVVAAFMPGWREGPPTEEKARSALGADVDGMLAEEVVLPELGLLPIPAHLSFEEAATLPCAAVTAWHGDYCGPRSHHGRPDIPEPRVRHSDHSLTGPSVTHTPDHRDGPTQSALVSHRAACIPTMTNHAGPTHTPYIL